MKVIKLYPLHSQGSFVFVYSIRIISLKMSDSTKERFYFIQNKFIWNYFYTIGDYNKYLNTIRGLIGRCNRYFRWWLYFNPSGFRYDPVKPWFYGICHTLTPFCLWGSAEKEGFEPPEPLGSTVFKTAAIDHSAISPIYYANIFFDCGAKIVIIFE